MLKIFRNGEKEKRRKIYWIIAQSAVYLSLYYITNYVAYIRNVERAWITVPVIDFRIPFLDFFVWPYISAYFLNTFGVFLITKDLGYETFKKITVAYFMNLFVLVCFYFMLPMKAIRVGIDPGSSIGSLMVFLLHKAMFPYNTFPSAHVSYSFLTALVAYSVRYKYRMVIFIDSSLIIFSTLFIKEHVLLDVVVGVILAFICFKEREKIYTLYLYIVRNYFNNFHV